jgi:eukaryotic-like serine/threonine-protein kinase
MTRDDATRHEASSYDQDRAGATDPLIRAEPVEDDECASATDIEECLRLLDKVWPPEESFEPEGQRTLGRFSILGELGRGGFGVVFLADDPLLERRVALKVPRIEILSGSEGWRRFVRESRTASRLDHPNLVPLLEAGAIGPLGYIISAFVAGPSLEQWLRHNRGGAPPRWAAQLVAALAHAIAYVHQRGILHRDLKPANVLLQSHGLGDEDIPSPEVWQGVALESWVPRI